LTTRWGVRQQGALKPLAAARPDANMIGVQAMQENTGNQKWFQFEMLGRGWQCIVVI